MALTAAERQRRCRGKGKNNADKVAEVKQKDLERYHAQKKLVKDMSVREHQLMKRNWQQRNKKRRDKNNTLQKDLLDKPNFSPAPESPRRVMSPCSPTPSSSIASTKRRNKKMDSKKRASIEQLEVLLSEVERRPHVLNSRVSGVGERVKSNEHWQKITDKLNSMGVEKTAAKWQQAWRDWKSNTRKKASKILEEKGKSGDSKVAQPLTDLEVRVLNLVGSDISDMKPPEIDISNIAEIDPLSSEEEEDEGSDPEPFLYTPDMVTVYSMGEPGGSDGVTVKNEDNSPPHTFSKKDRKIKRHRVEFRQTSLSTERLRKEMAEILTRLYNLEENRHSLDEKNASMLERVAHSLDANTAAMARQAEAADKQARALERLAAVIESRSYYNSENPGVLAYKGQNAQ